MCTPTVASLCYKIMSSSPHTPMVERLRQARIEYAAALPPYPRRVETHFILMLFTSFPLLPFFAFECSPRVIPQTPSCLPLVTRVEITRGCRQVPCLPYYARCRSPILRRTLPALHYTNTHLTGGQRPDLRSAEVDSATSYTLLDSPTSISTKMLR